MVRDAEEHEVEQLARIWYDAWHDAHAHLMPESLVRQRTLESFADRIRTALPEVRVGHTHEPVGICIIKDDELYQLFVAARARGTGIAAQLVADAEARLAERGVTTAWLACAIGNDRAARFYERCGWQRTATTTYQPEVPEGNITFDVWRYGKTLRSGQV